MTFKSEMAGTKPLGDTVQTFGSLVPWKQVASELGVCTRSIARWQESDPSFPPVIKIHERKYLTDTGFAEYKVILICGLPVAEIANESAILFLWATAPKLAEAMQVIAAWGFAY